MASWASFPASTSRSCWTTSTSVPEVTLQNDGAGCKDSLAPNEVSWNCNSWRSGGPAISHPEWTSFDFLDEILRKVSRRDVFPNLRAIVVSGHSAGGQVVNRYQMTNQMHDKFGVPVTYVVSNPSSYAYPSDERPTSAAWALTANAPRYIPEVSPTDKPFASLGSGRGCTAYNQWPYGLENHTGYSAKQSEGAGMKAQSRVLLSCGRGCSRRCWWTNEQHTGRFTLRDPLT